MNSESDSNSDIELIEVEKQNQSIETKPKPQAEAILEQYFTCGICSDILYEPYTLLCQHTFCKACLSKSKPGDMYSDSTVNSIHKCPTCNLSYILHPKNNNYLITTYIESLVSDDYKLTRNREKLKETLEMEVRKELKSEIFKTLYEDTLVEVIQKQNNQSNTGMSPIVVPYYQPIQPKSNWSDFTANLARVIALGYMAVVGGALSYNVLTGKHLLAQ